MPKKKPGMTPEGQSERFEAEVERLIAGGELNATEASAELDRLLKGQAKAPKVDPDPG